ncbi:Polyadenylate-binding protein-interacting protein 2B [Orchesella cincta]|uniref:Polyadenylate-binding protein-interacting protein 2B n=1 Tax=Orchesella cincta TaxID=48709 RepID=A0A1D2NGR0_ORCCI|nr:Polyadenylate-binding protein-interacting protein 2B [Orchesella cincta]
MKLPTDNSSNSEEQSVSSSSENGGAAAAEGNQPQAAASGSNAGSGGNQSSSQPGTGEPAVDFSEYLWMENEEEFDSQVLQELEDEEMINYYYELYEASLNENGTWGPNTANIRFTGPPPPFTNPSSGSEQEDSVEALTQGMNSRLSLGGGGGSRLNPEAAEFVPRAANMSSPN